MKLGIIIGIDEYINYPDKNLPASKNDAILMEKVVEKAKEFNDSLVIKGGKVVAKELKNKIEAFVKKHSDKEIEELFFYFSGHGMYENEEFYYICSDYDSSKKRTTTLENSELDVFIKSIKPKLTVKVVDACQSGVNYVKDINSLGTEVGKVFDKSIGNFDKCYFMFSSENHQKSYASEKISFFTNSFLNCIKSNVNNGVRYKDIIDFISDEFETNKRQTPHFITQASHTEIFIQATNDIIKTLELNDSELIEREKQEGKSNLIDIISKDSEKYCTQEEVVKIFQDIKYALEALNIDEEISKLFEISKFFGDDDDAPNRKAIANWLGQQKDIFAKPTYVKVKRTKRVRKKLSSIQLLQRSMNGGGYTEDDYRLIEEEVLEASDFDRTTDFPFSEIRIDLFPKYPNLSRYSMHIVPLVSKITMHVFFGVQRYEIEDWNKYSPLTDSFKWEVKSIEMKNDNVIDVVSEIYQGGYAEIKEEITNRFLRQMDKKDLESPNLKNSDK